MNGREDLSPRESAPTVKIALPSARHGGWMLEIQDDVGLKRVPVDATVVIGSRRSANIVVDDETVSAAHVEASPTADALVFRDLGSTNGTWTGGARVMHLSAVAGTVVTIGQSTLVVRPLADPEDDEEVGTPLASMAGGSLVMRRLAAVVRRLARLSAPVLVAGETGSGKELVARALHLEGPRSSAPFVALNVATMPRELVESELFGHERGAFTGAVQRRVGAFTEAEGGTLLLDEIGELAMEAQPKLLRALDGYEVRRVGAIGAGRRPDARVVAATHVPLLDHVIGGKFRRDLYHRLEVFVIEVPPLRERASDIPDIAKRYLAQLEGDFGRRKLTSAAIAQLAVHDWPGNVRELRNVLLRAADLSRDRIWIDASTVERALRKTERRNLTLTPEQAKEWLMAHRGNVSAAARAAGVPRTTFRKLFNGGLGGARGSVDGDGDQNSTDDHDDGEE